ncbi:MAG: hypothetical protein IT456_24330 [Planctomycetes bacterium]|nr:hypothetical protein [Planctomycetota bacterium]
MHKLHSLTAIALLIAPAMAQFAPLPAPNLLTRTAPRATWTAVVSAGLCTTGSTFRSDAPGAATNSKIYVFGGCLNNNTSTTVNDLWEFDAVAGTYTQVHNGSTSLAPHARGRHAMAWNPLSNKLVVFGGDNRATGPLPADTLLADTWEYDLATGTWTDLTPVAGSPSPRRWCTMAFDATFGGMVMFGGDLGAGITTSETWLWNGSAWALLSSGAVPARRMAGLVNRPAPHNDVLMCGGEDTTSVAPEVIRHLDVWSWSGGTWTKISDYDWATGTGTFPASTTANQAVYDQLRQRIVMQSGQGIAAGTAANATYIYGTTLYNGSPSNYTSEFDSVTNSWSLYASSTAGTAPYNNNDPVIGRISRYSAAYVPATGKVYALGGQNPNNSGSKPTYSVYAYQANPVATATSYGAGCTGSAGALSLASNNLPWTQRTFSATGTGFPAGSLGFAAVGFTTAATPLSLLHPAGGAGCDLLVNPDVSLLLLPTAGNVNVQLAMPTDPAYAGIVLNTQCLCLEFGPSFNLTAITSTNGLALQIGAL